ncbi:MAG: hypothetical protein GW928_08975, partial [Rhodoferax sp.]|nr:hypothetical protein [Rhodoferax sp.]
MVSWIDMPVTSASATSTVMSYSAQLDGNIMMTIYGQANGSGGMQNLGVAVGTSTPLISGSSTVPMFYVHASGTTAAAFNRQNSDGTVISILQDGTEEGTITVSGNTVSYNAFTGSHYAIPDNADEEFEKGTLVTLTGNNKNLHDNVESEIM